MKIAIVTGASSGLGREFVRKIAVKEKLDAIWIIARREEKLREIAEGLPVQTVPIPLDLTKQDSFACIQELLEKEKPDVRILVNAAGFGKMGSYSDISVRDGSDMVDLNCRALMQMTLITLPYMSKGARILEICSVASYQPLPELGVYAASKAFAQSFSRSLRWELFPRGIHVTAVCPYWIKDTEFISIARDTKAPRAVRHMPLASGSRFVVSVALFDSKLNLPVSAPGPVSLLARFFTKFIPHEITIAIWELLRLI